MESQGHVIFHGRSYLYRYPEPSEQEIEDKAKEICNKRPDIRFVDAKMNAEYMLRAEKIAEVEKKVTEAIDKAEKDLKDNKAEPGISQRQQKKIDLMDYAGGVLSHEEVTRSTKYQDANYFSSENALDLKVISDKDAAAQVVDLVAEMNADLYAYRKAREEGDTENKAIDGGIAPDKKIIDLKIPSPDQRLSFGEQVHTVAIHLGGNGDFGSQFAQEMTRFNRFGKNLLPAARELTGFTFITRPHLNLSQANLSNQRTFAPLLFCDGDSVQCMIRLLLDTKLGGPDSSTGKDILCQLIDRHNPFNVPLCNALQSITGFPDPNLAVETSEGGFFSEQQTSVIGPDRMAHGYDLQLNFRDYVGGPIMAMHDYWCQYMGLLGDGSMSQYTEDIEQNLMGYTVSIYRFITDHTGRHITRWAKATGCFPKMVPTGNVFNTNPGEQVVQSAREFSIPYWAHHISQYNDPIILREFNTLVERYAAWIRTDEAKENSDIRHTLYNNRCGIPYISQDRGYNELVWRFKEDYFPERKAVLSPTKWSGGVPAHNEALDRSVVFPG